MEALDGSGKWLTERENEKMCSRHVFLVSLCERFRCFVTAGFVFVWLLARAPMGWIFEAGGRSLVRTGCGSSGGLAHRWMCSTDDLLIVPLNKYFYLLNRDKG
jgi:hypothetical protein